MTLHASKGLEFPVVYLVAVEEGLLPHERSRDLPDELEEERRLMFVGMTRAKQELQISRAVYRDFRGQRKLTIPSRFLMELPRGEMEVVEHKDDIASGFSQPAIESPTRPRVGELAARTAGRPSLMTAAEIAGGELPPVDPDQFAQGMIVRHPENGLGRIVALSGVGAERVATVDFASPPRREKFVLSQSPLRPLRPARPQIP